MNKKTFIERFEENVIKYPDKPAVRSYGQRSGVSTYSKLNRRAGMVYRYLKEHGIGREDFVMICLPRSIRTVICLMGVIKAGAAFVIVEDTYSQGRIDFIYKDCGCKMKIDIDLLAEMMECEPLEGHEETDPHDAAYAVYTSGTTGNPKGVLHEYGNMDQCVESIYHDGESILNSDDLFAMIAPLNFVAFPIALLKLLAEGGTLFIVPYSVAKNFDKLQEFLINEKITSMFMTASYIRAYKNPSPFLRQIIVSSEPANGLHVEGPRLLNVHAMSETGFNTSSFELDRAYDVAPIGKPGFDLKTCILDEEGNEVSDGEIGEYCFENTYVRGYINLPEKTAEAFRDGLFHSGDLARKDADGNVILVGRNDDMIKINGNRIEPAEIEAACRDTLGIENVVAKGFDEGKRAFVCLYFLNEEAKAAGILKKPGRLSITVDEIKDRLSDRLPYYMIPTYYEGLDEFPKNANGKLYRKELEVPSADEYREEYEAPETELEKMLSDAFAKVLELERAGVNEDFYLIGGDSLATIQVLAECGLPGMTTGMIFENRTPKKIAQAYGDMFGEPSDDMEEENAKALKGEWPLPVEQEFVLDEQFVAPKSTMWNLSKLFRLKDDVDPERLAAAIDRAIKNHPAMLTEILFNEESELVQKYNPDLFTETEIVRLSDGEFEDVQETLIRPYKVLNSCMFRRCIYITDSEKYLFFEVHHIISDGTSLGVFFDDVHASYNDMEAPLNTDFYYLMLRENYRFLNSNKVQEVRKYYIENFAEKYDLATWSKLSGPDNPDGSRTYGYIEKELTGLKKQAETSANLKKYGGNVLFSTARMLTLAELTGSRHIYIECVINGRNEAYKAYIQGLMYKTLSIALDLDEYDTPEKQLSEVQKQLRYGEDNAFYLFAYDYYETIGDAELFLYQKDIYNLGGFGELIDESIEIEAEDNAADAIYEVEIIDSSDDDEYTCTVQFDSSMYKEETIDRHIEVFRKKIAGLL